jgi:hypothetical protein
VVTATMAMPIHPDLQELWHERGDDAPVVVRHRGTLLSTFLIWGGLFLLGFGAGGVYQSVIAAAR